jgi:RNA polymerase sigma factor (sigma-70 family)
MSEDPVRPATSSTGTDAVNAETTAGLLARARGGDASAFDRLLSRHLAPLRRWTRGRLPRWARDLADTDDLVQDVLLNTVRNIDAFDVRGVGALQAYLRQAVLNRVRDELRKSQRRPGAVDLTGFEVDRGSSPVEEAIGHEAAARYEGALARLSSTDREAIIGRVEMGYSYLELAELLEKPTADAARKTAQRALVRLAREMDLEGG